MGLPTGPVRVANPSLQRYIPAGCLLCMKETSNVPDDVWPSDENRSRWMSFSHPDDVSTESEPILGRHVHPLPRDLQKLLLHSIALEPFARLFHKQWIQLQFSVSKEHDDRGILRVYILPDDVDHRSIPRFEGKLRKDLQALLMSLDYCKGIWHGSCEEPQSQFPLRFGQSGDDDEGNISLLQMFNTIPSPVPRPDLTMDRDYQAVLDELLTNKVPGLKTQLYGYQTRSAAVMLQREVAPGQVLDPRLLHVLDQHGGSWYYDDVCGTALREPRHYDGIPGGILAEEMGTGKTLICLALILATKEFPAETPEIHRSSEPKMRERVGSLADMAAAVTTRDSVPWGLYLRDYPGCVEAIQRNPGQYLLSGLEPRRASRHPQPDVVGEKISLSSCSLVLVPNNLVKQWEQEIAKHTMELRVLTITGKSAVPGRKELLTYDIILFSIGRFEQLIDDRQAHGLGWRLSSPLAKIHFKRVIVDEGHRLGNSRIGNKSRLLLILECLNVSARWIVTGTPSTGLFGIDSSSPATPAMPVSETSGIHESFGRLSSRELGESSGADERKDLERIGAMASLYLKARPWANTVLDGGDTLADWSIYVMQPKHSARSSGRKDSLRATLDSLIIRHRWSEIGDLLPPVDEKIVQLDGSYQDKLALNLFSMMIIFNAVQSQREDQDYFFHHSQRKALLELVYNIRQSSFFGGSFFSVSEVSMSIETAEKFLEEKKVIARPGDEQLLRDAIAFGHLAVKNHLKGLAETFHEVPIYVKDFPGGATFGQAWSLDEKGEDPLCTNAPLIRALQQLLRPCVDAPHSLQAMFNDGRFVERGKEERLNSIGRRLATSQTAAAQHGSRSHTRTTLAGNTRLGEDNSPIKRRSGSLGTPARMESIPAPNEVPETEIAQPLAQAQIISTASAKLSYLIDSIVKYQNDEQIIVFYENENVAFYLAEHLEILQIHHLIYAKGITAERRAQYVDTFNHNPKFRVLLMDISQAAFGLDMRSASRIYFTNPVLNPQVEAQAIGRVRRISQKKQVSVETLVLRGSLEEVIMERRQRMTQAEHRKCKSILDDRPIYEWILNAKILALPEDAIDSPAQMAPLQTPQFLFGRGFGRVEHPDEGLVLQDSTTTTSPTTTAGGSNGGRAVATNGAKRALDVGPGAGETPVVKPKPKRSKVSVRFVEPDEA